MGDQPSRARLSIFDRLPDAVARGRPATARCRLRRRLLTVLSLACLATAGIAQSATLVGRFDLEGNHAWKDIELRLAQGPWHAGTINGSIATDAEIRAVLAKLTRLTIGARCASVRDGDLTYPCGFALSRPDFGGQRDTDPEGMLRGWRGTLGYAVRGRFDTGDQASVIALDAPESGPRDPGGGGTSPLLRFIGFTAPPEFLGNQSGTVGRTLSFRFRSVPSGPSPGDFDRSSGIVSLSNDPAPLPQRSTGLEIPIVVAAMYAPNDKGMLAYALDSKPGMSRRDDHHDVTATLGRWVRALNARSVDDLAAVYHRQARLFDGQPVFASENPEGLQRHLDRTPHLATWRVLRYRIRTDGTSGQVDVYFDLRGNPTTGPAGAELGLIRLHLAREETRWSIVSHGPWISTLPAP